jgi:hypothetical protein
MCEVTGWAGPHKQRLGSDAQCGYLQRPWNDPTLEIWESGDRMAAPECVCA